MSTTTIGTAIITGVTIGAGAYAGTGTLVIASNGSIYAHSTFGAVYGVAAPADQSNISISNAGLITSNWGGVQIENSTDIFSNSGSIIAAFQPLLQNGGQVFNSGYIGASGSADYGVSVLNGNFTNSGSITGFFGAAVTASETTFDNTGRITGKYEAVYVHDEATLINGGNLLATGNYGTGVLLKTGLVENSGTIAGFYGIQLGDTRSIISAEVINSGMIEGFHGQAIDAYGQLLLEILPGAAFDGSVDNSDNDTTLMLGGTVQGSLDIGNFAGVSSIAFAPDAAWTLAGGTGQLAGGQSIGGFTQGDTLVLNGFAATGSNYRDGTGLVLSNATASETLDITGTFAANAFTATEANGNTTITALVSTISSNVSFAPGQKLTLGSGGYASSLTITSTGAVGGGYPYGANIVGSGTITNAGQIVYGVHLSGSSTVINTGIIKDGVLLQSGLVVDSGGIQPPFDLFDMIEAQTSLTVLLEPGAGISGGIVDIAGNGTLVLAGDNPALINFDDVVKGLKGFDQISFAAGHHDLAVRAADFSYGVTLTGFGQGDTLQINADNVFTGASYVTGAGIILNGQYGTSTTLAISGGAPAGGFVFTTQAAGMEIDITAACFCLGTRISAPHGNIAVERLAIGDMVNTDLGPACIKWIGRRDYDGGFIAGNHLALPVKIRRHALAFNVPSRDVFISPDHGVCEGGVFVPAWRLVNGVSITQAESVERVEYFHIELEKPAVIFAENMPVESFVDAACRARFQNASEYDLLYPEPAPPQKPCRPRIEDGFLLQRIQARINARAGLALVVSGFGPLRGCIDETGPRLRGWAQDSRAPETPVLLEILRDGVVTGLILANAYRPDLRKAGLGSGCHAFDVAAPPGDVTLRRVGDGATIAAGSRRAA